MKGCAVHSEESKFMNIDDTKFVFVNVHVIEDKVIRQIEMDVSLFSEPMTTLDIWIK